MKLLRSATTIVTDSINSSPLRRGFLLIPLVLTCFALLPSAWAVTPAPDGSYPGYNTAEGLNALSKASLGVWNTAIGAYSPCF
jgi:Na+/proline symporter